MRIEIINGSVEYDGNTVLSEINFSVSDKEKIALVGRNGSGKTSILKCISGEVPLVSGTGDEKFSLSISGAPKIGYLQQVSLNDELTLRQEILSAYKDVVGLENKLQNLLDKMSENPSDENVGAYSRAMERFKNIGGYLYKKEYLTAVSKFGFSAEDLDKKLSCFSGGQRTKIALMKLLLEKPDVLLLDEPTNHLDIAAVEWLEGYLKNYKNSVVIVSHDRYLINRVAKSLIVFENGGVRYFDGTFDEYEEREKETAEEVAKEKPEKTKKTGGERYVESKEEARRKHRVEFLEKKITALEEELSRVQAKLDDETVNTDYKKVMAVEEEIKTIEEKLDPLITEWTELSE